jgi:hypothetical protein
VLTKEGLRDDCGQRRNRGLEEAGQIETCVSVEEVNEDWIGKVEELSLRGRMNRGCMIG